MDNASSGEEAESFLKEATSEVPSGIFIWDAGNCVQEGMRCLCLWTCDAAQLGVQGQYKAMQFDHSHSGLQYCMLEDPKQGGCRARRLSREMEPLSKRRAGQS